MSEVLNRYDRQERIDGWNQEKLKNAKIAIVGSGHISNFLSSDLAALGVGEIRIYDDSRADYQITGKPYREREFLISRLGEGRSKVEALEKKVSKINPLIEVYGLHMELDSITEQLVEKPDLMITTVNELETIKKYSRFALKNSVQMYAALGDKNGGIFLKNNLKIPDYTGREQEGIVSEVIAGLLAGEVLQTLMYNKGIDYLEYSPSETRFKLGGKINTVSLKGKKAVVIGAGALGNFFSIGLAHAEVGKIYLVDSDTIETTNLNRQILFYEKVGEPKAETLAERLMEINPNISVEPIQERVSEKFESKIKKIEPDILVDCVDNLATRAILNHFALRYEIPLISGGTDYQKGQAVVYEPGKSACLECRLGVDKALAEARQSHSCIHAPVPSVVIINHIIGGIMAAEARCVLAPEDYGEAVRKIIKYDSTKSARVGLIGAEEPCNCKRKTPASLWVKKLVA